MDKTQVAVVGGMVLLYVLYKLHEKNGELQDDIYKVEQYVLDSFEGPVEKPNHKQPTAAPAAPGQVPPTSSTAEQMYADNNKYADDDDGMGASFNGGNPANAPAREYAGYVPQDKSGGRNPAGRRHGAPQPQEPAQNDDNGEFMNVDEYADALGGDPILGGAR